MRKKSGLIILLLALTGCANTAGDSVKDTVSITQSLPVSTEASESSIDKSEDSIKDGETSVGKQMDIYEDDGLRLELVSELDGAGNIVPESVRLKIENSMDDECMIRSIGTAVNNMTIGNSLKYAEIDGNDSTEEEVMLSKLEMGLAGISSISSYELFLRVGTGEEGKLVSLTLSGTDTNADTAVPQYEGTVVYDDEFVKIKSQGILEDGLYFSPTVRLVIENKKDEILFIDIDNSQATVNGEETLASIGSGVWVFPHTVCFVEPDIPMMASISDQLKKFETQLIVMDYGYQELAKVDIKISDDE